MRIFLNGRLLPREEAHISVFDRGFLFGDGVFETMRAYDGVIFRCGEHLGRLYRSAKVVSIPIPYDTQAITNFLYQTLQANGHRNARIRITVTRGENEPGQMDASPETPPTLCIVSTHFSGHPEEKYQRGIRADFVRTRQVPPEVLDPRAKSLNRLSLVMARREILGSPAEEALLLTLQGHVAEGTTSNIFLVKDGVLITPSLSLGILDGITRKEVLQIAVAEGIPCLERLLKPEDVMQADECFLSSTTYEVMPVTNIGGQPIALGMTGSLTKILGEQYRRSVRGV